MSTDNIVVSTNVIQTVTNTATNTVNFETVLHEPIITGSQGPQGPQGISAATSVGSLTDVRLGVVNDGSLLVYNASTEVWEATTNLDKQALECGQY